MAPGLAVGQAKVAAGVAGAEANDVMNYTVDAVDRALCLLFLVADQPGLGVTELSRRSGITKARSYRLLETLEKSGVIRRHENAAIYSLSYMALFLGAAAQEQIKLVRLTKKYLFGLGQQFNEHVYVRVRDGIESVCIARFDSSQAVRIHTKVGSRMPLYAGASGKLLLAYATAEIQEAVLEEEKEKFTANTIVERNALERHLDEIREQGYSISQGEQTAGTVSLAFPIRDAFGTVVAVLGVAVPSGRMRADKLTEFLDALRKAAWEFSCELGYVG